MGVYQVVGMNVEVLETNITLHPGEVLGEELDAREILRKACATAVNISPLHLREIIKGKRSITARLALKLEKELGLEAGFLASLANGLRFIYG